MISCQRGKADWDMEPTLVSTFLNDDGLRLEEWLADDRVRIIKTGPHRTVYAVDLAQGRFFLKHYRTTGILACLRNIVRRPKPWLEFDASQRVKELGIDSVEIVALGRIRRTGLVTDSFLMSRAIEKTKQLDEFLANDLPRLPNGRRSKVRKNLAVELGKLTAKLYIGGLVHGDYHTGNLLCQLDENDAVRLWLVDLHPIANRDELGLREIRANLSQLYAPFATITTPTDRLRFLHHLWSEISSIGVSSATARNLYPRAFGNVVRQIERRGQTELRIAWERQDRKWARGNRRLFILDRDDVACRGVAALGKEFLKTIRDAPEQLLHSINHSERSSTTSNQTEILPLKQGDLSCRIEYQKGTVDDPEMRNGWSRIRRSWEYGHALIRRGIRTEEPLLFVEPACRKDQPSFIAFREQAELVPLSQFLECDLPQRHALQQPKLLGAIAFELGKTIGLLHDRGFNHDGLSVANFAVVPGERRSEIAVCRVAEFQRPRTMSRRDVVCSLASLLASVRLLFPVRQVEAVRLLKKYALVSGIDSWKTLARDLMSELKSRGIPSPFDAQSPSERNPTLERQKAKAA